MASRGLWHFMSARTRRSLALSWSALFIVSLLLQYFSFALASPALAVHDDGLFELDGNAIDQAAAGDDWDTVKAGTSSAEQTKFITDAVNSTPDEHLFTGGGSKDGQDISSWKWTSGPGVQDKNDIEHAFAAAYTSGTDTFIYFGQDRYAQDGDAFVGFWFLKSAVSEKAGGTFNGVHQDGDILVQADFTNGGVIQDFKISKWLSGALHQIDTGLECPAPSVPLLDDSACGKVNGTAIGEINAPWDYTPKSGTANKIPQGGFFEAGINLTSLHLDEGCFSTFVSETRSSQSLTSTLSDYAMGSFSFCTTPDISTQVKQGTTSLGDNGNITIGESVTDVATLTGTKGTVTGTVDFFQCFSATATPDCTTGGTAVAGNPKTLSDGIATSGSFTPDAVGHYCFRAEYHAATGSKYLDVNHTNITSECFDVLKKVPTITTAAAQTVDLNQSISDSATLAGATADAGGTITFRAYGPNNATCASPAVFTSTPVAVSGNGTYGPVSFSPSAAGTYRWIASYSGDAKNAAKAGACNDDGENDTVNKLTPAIATQASAAVTIGGTITDTATVSGGSSPTGTVTFVVYGPADTTCANGTVVGSPVALSGGTATSAAYTTTAVGTYHWIATYNGDANNNAVGGHCGDANESVVVNPTTPSITTSLVSGTKTGAAIGVTIGSSVHDTSILSSATADAGGTVHYQVFSDSNCQTLASDAGTIAVVNAVPGDSNAVVFDHAGTFYWQADYSGDAKNGKASSACNLETVTVAANAPSISTTLQSGNQSGATITVLFGSSVSDQATLTGASATAGGTVTYTVYSGATCTTVFANAGTKNVTNGVVPASNPVSFPTPGTYYWKASYSGDADNAPATSVCTDEVVTVTTPNLNVTKLVATNDGDFGSTSSAMPGDTLNYEITIGNSGNATATNVPVSDDISPILAHATYNGDCSNSCSFASDTLTWTIPSIAAGGSITLSFSVTLDATFPTGTTDLPNVVVVTGPGSNCAAGSEDAACATVTTVATSRLVIAKSVTGNTAGTDPDLGVPAANVGDTLHYSLKYTGAGVLTNAVITDVLPDGLEFVAGSAVANADFNAGTYDTATRTITWHAKGVLPDPASGTVTYDAKVLSTAPGVAQPLVNVASIDSDETGLVSDTASVAVLAPPLALTPPPTDTFTPETGTSNPGFTLMLILLGVAGLALGIGFVTPVPARVRRRDRLG